MSGLSSLFRFFFKGAQGAEPNWYVSYRLLGSLLVRAAARAIGSNDFAALANTGVDREDSDSRSARWFDRRLAGASSETLRRDKKP